MEFTLHPIGIIRSPFSNTEEVPVQASRSKARGQVLVDLEYTNGLEGLEGFSHIFLIYIFHCSSAYELKVKPFLDNVTHGLFATRFPCRPNPIGISVVRLLSVRENIMEVEGLDVLDGTPLLDIKPYVPDFDVRTGTHTGWYEMRSKP
jgi:tRNA-Thr(GGU) m(6)t(6)A37 methyltransferase TsaA